MNSLQLSHQEAAKQLLRRRRARANLIDYARFTNRAYRPANHHHQIAEALQRVEAGECKRLMIFMPPRHGKSELASRRFPAWFMGRNPARSTIAASYNSDLARDFGREVRNIVATPEHRALFPQGMLAQDSKAQNRWHTADGGGYTAAGVGTAVTGRGAHILLIDDPVKDRESADSETIRERTYKWYLSTAYTRLEGTITDEDEDPLWRDIEEAQQKGQPFEGAVVLIQTRWHEDDLAGRLLADMERGADQWEVLSLPALSDGKALWPAKFSAQRLEKIKTQLSSREWTALYQQEPTPDQGTFFERQWFKRHDAAPENVRKFIFSDFAVTEDDGDFTEFGVFGIGADDVAYECDWWSGQTTSAAWIERAVDLMEKHKPHAFFGETGVIRRAIEPALRKRMRERKVFCRLVWLTRSLDKAASARAIQARAENGLVSISNSFEGSAVIDQAVAFPAGKHDDKVDVLSLLGMAIDQAHPALNFDKQQKSKPKRPSDYQSHRGSEESWKVV
ncbi:MAG: terminase family protein [Pseudomonadota bacterium]